MNSLILATQCPAQLLALAAAVSLQNCDGKPACSQLVVLVFLDVEAVCRENSWNALLQGLVLGFLTCQRADQVHFTASKFIVEFISSQVAYFKF